MRKSIFIYALALATATFLLSWLEYQYLSRAFATEIYIVLLAAGFSALGVWTGWRLTRRPPAGPFEKNQAALDALGVTAREYEVLERLAAGESNKEIARSLDLSPNTVKTHLARLYEKLEVSRRTQAIQKAKDLALIP